ncbi:scarecrow transcription factor family protein [Striga asiatica]|uniref:Scarecrow transcription factor family protein n=1 Tax=Striga asiatica TaxID=4170 RepID=A0A5A7PGH9_STRAF|nr:scarecrow transcription factor family protein [Striga asiatica]
MLLDSLDNYRPHTTTRGRMKVRKTWCTKDIDLGKLLTGAAMRDFLGVMLSTNPNVVVLAEQEGEHDGSGLELRHCNALRYYVAVFDSVDAGLPFGRVEGG